MFVLLFFRYNLIIIWDAIGIDMVEIWLDTIDEEVIEFAQHTGVLFGVTTNPSILANAKDVKSTLKKLLDLQEGPVAVQVTSMESSQMVAEAKALSRFSKRISVKIPLSHSGLVAIKELRHEKISLIGTAVMSLNQALIALSLPLEYIAIYYSRISSHPIEFIKTLRDLYDNHSNAPKILAASLKQMTQVTDCVLHGVDAVTLKPDQYAELLHDPKECDECLYRFSNDWNAQHGSSKLTDLI